MGPRKLTHEMLVAACAQTPHEVADLVMALALRVADLEAQVKELTRQLHQNSRNSSKLPSSDGYTRNRRPKVGGRKAANRAEGNRGILGPGEPCGMIPIMWSCIRRPTVSTVGRISKTARPPGERGDPLQYAADFVYPVNGIRRMPEGRCLDLACRQFR